MDAVLSKLPTWLPDYWVWITLIRLVISLFVLYIFGRTMPIEKPAVKTATIVMASIALLVWGGGAIFLGSYNVFLIDENTLFPPPIAAGAFIPLFVGYLAFRHWAPFRRLIFNIPQHWLIALQVYRITGGVFLIVYGMGLVPGAFGLTAGIGDLVTGSLAIPVAYFCYKRKSWSRKLALMWNYLGLAELIILIPSGILTSPLPAQMLSLDAPNYITSSWPSVLAPTFHVPLGILLHIFSLALLSKEDLATNVQPRPRNIAWQSMLIGAITYFLYAALFYIASPLATDRTIAFHIYPDLRDSFAAHYPALYIHIVPSMLALILGPLQFLPSLRNKHRNAHRLSGRIYLVSILIGGVGAFFLAQASFIGLPARIGFGLQSSLLLFTGYMAYSNIRQGKITVHREWMMRNYALIFGAVTLRIYIRIFFLMGLELPDFHGINAFLCWIPNLLFVEWLIYRSRERPSKGRPAIPVVRAQS